METKALGLQSLVWRVADARRARSPGRAGRMWLMGTAGSEAPAQSNGDVMHSSHRGADDGDAVILQMRSISLVSGEVLRRRKLFI